MRRALVAGNWKMNGTATFAQDLATRLAVLDSHGMEVAVCPPFPYLERVAKALEGSSVILGAQDMACEPPGALTGAVAAEMLLDVGCRLVILGHSERRTVFLESDALVAAKVSRALGCGLVPVLCVGETVEERDAGRTLEVVARQLDAVLQACGPGAFPTTVVAYEPVWAIGTGRTATPEQAAEVHGRIRARLAVAGADAASTRVLYGGSVKPDNAAELFAMEDIDGGLIGGAALDARDFQAICKAARS